VCQQSLLSECALSSKISTKFLFGYPSYVEAPPLTDVCFSFAFSAHGLFLFALIAVAWQRERHWSRACAMRNWPRGLMDRRGEFQRCPGRSNVRWLSLRQHTDVGVASDVGTRCCSVPTTQLRNILTETKATCRPSSV
jgi:hypothetical protein